MYETLESEHLRLRKARETDWRSMMKHIWGGERYAWFVALKDTDEAIGLCAMTETELGHFEECGIGIGAGFSGKGIWKGNRFPVAGSGF